ncbi:MAG TPA: hypothetical protein VL574_13540, partial [Stellaceae bacterium]|nr:hypothetical protein [Stellaceae bacterium]
SSDIFQAAVSTVIGVGFGALVASAAAVAVPLVVIYTVVVATGFIASWGLNALDNQYNLTQNLVDYAVTKENDSKSFLYKAENTGFRIWRETVGMMQVKDNMLRAALSEQ